MSNKTCKEDYFRGNEEECGVDTFQEIGLLHGTNFLGSNVIDDASEGLFPTVDFDKLHGRYNFTHKIDSGVCDTSGVSSKSTEETTHESLEGYE